MDFVKFKRKLLPSCHTDLRVMCHLPEAHEVVICSPRYLTQRKMWTIAADGSAFWWNVDTFSPGTQFSVEITNAQCALPISGSRVLIGSESTLYIVDAKAHTPTSQVLLHYVK